MKKMLRILLLRPIILLLTINVHAQIIKDTLAQSNWSLHLQVTVIPQYHFNFGAAYTGANSLQTAEPVRTSFTNTYYIGRRLWKHAAVYINPEIAGGEGLSKATGVAGFPNGETFRIGSAAPKLYLARAYLEQLVPLQQEAGTWVENDQNQLRAHLPAAYLALRAGKFSLADFFDDNSYSHDPRTDFMNWSLMSAGAWDYPANTRGYTNGFALELRYPSWALRTAIVQVPVTANGQKLDNALPNAFGIVAEAEKKWLLGADRTLVTRLGAFYNKAGMGNYRDAITKAMAQSVAPDIATARMAGREKKGFYFNAEYNTKAVGALFRYSVNDGKNETWAFTEIDRSLSAGISIPGHHWRRAADKLGLALVRNGLSADHRAYLAAGGYGFIIGDGQLRYASEHIVEVFYSYFIPAVKCTLSPDYQWVLHPAYNKDRGPVHIVALRLHFEL
ncbi:MAG TPA: carbohydrate porin [Chitinophagaceae bacterium]|nr:carbohydrate porin [Chitinophagaceae bacterium]